ncbi:2'-5' RNA ligase [Legionella massiliensis]|uniref:RNA 2',3'-cyclic phosphodiesterase n=1 Tax=Legionella massiliensis TaxID=1034943 RepID=A0A078KXQ9_9GAMM|nr:RNA 2',3'-cyclic phosphodiesterase [Legionella massiliensis]CDZ76539.1 2'-5' RNA ligase [Legionella massiliensis]CEE12277.1 2',5' RNA ligase family [Legionella massiliensis]
MKPLRVFFAIRLPKPILALLKEIQTILNQSLPAHQVRWTPVENLHVTLQFLQSFQPADLAMLSEKIQGILRDSHAFDLQLGQLEFFPSIKHPVVLALQAGPNEVLANLAKLISSEIAALNYLPAQEHFRGHLTIGRLAHRRQQTYSLDAIRLSPIPAAKINEIVLFESQTGSEHQIYTVLKHFHLG